MLVLGNTSADTAQAFCIEHIQSRFTLLPSTSRPVATILKVTKTINQTAIKYWDCIVPGKVSPARQDAEMEDLTAEAGESSQGSEECGEDEMEESKEIEETDS